MANRHEPWVEGRDGIDPVMADATRWFVLLHEDPTDLSSRPAFEAWRDADPRHAAAFARLQRLWGASAHLSSLARPAASVDRRRLLAGVAGTGVAALAVGAGGRLALGPHPFATYRTRAGERSTVILADGSRLELSTATAVAVEFTDMRRRIRLLDGEAWFQVADDAARPFVVETAGGVTTALGTAFAVTRGREGTRVSVTEHAVQVEAGGRRAKVGEGRSIAYGPGGLAMVEGLDPLALAWREGRLNFVDRPLGEVAAALDRWTGGRTIVMDDDLAARPVTLTIGARDAGQGVDRLAGATPLRVRRPMPNLTIITAV